MKLLSTPFDYTTLEGTEKGTEDRGIAVLKMVMDYAGAVIIDALEINNRAVRDGRYETGLRYNTLASSVLFKAGMDDESLKPLIESSMDLIMNAVLDNFLKEGTIIKNQDDTFSANWAPIEDDEEVEPEFRDTELDGVTYPMVTQLSPDRVVSLSKNQKMFDALYPQGDFTRIVTGAKHIEDDLVFATQHSGNWLYTLV